MIFLYFIGGFIAGVLVCVLIVTTLAYFKKTIERHIEIVQQRLEAAGPQPRGFIVEPDDEATEVRNQIIEKNRREGRDTSISELI